MLELRIHCEPPRHPFSGVCWCVYSTNMKKANGEKQQKCIPKHSNARTKTQKDRESASLRCPTWWIVRYFSYVTKRIQICSTSLCHTEFPSYTAKTTNSFSLLSRTAAKNGTATYINHSWHSVSTGIKKHCVHITITSFAQ